MGNKIVAIQGDGSQKDITEGVQICYDLLRQSLDWGSGFLDVDEVDAVIRLAHDSGFADFEELIKSVWAERRKSRLPEPRTPRPITPGYEEWEKRQQRLADEAVAAFAAERDTFLAEITKEDR